MPDDPANSSAFHAVVDRIEDGGIAVIRIGDGERDQIDLPAGYLPEGAGEGDHLRITIEADSESRRRAVEEIRKLHERTATGEPRQEPRRFKL